MTKRDYMGLAQALRDLRPAPGATAPPDYLAALDDATRAIARYLSYIPKFDADRFCRNAGAGPLRRPTN